MEGLGDFAVLFLLIVVGIAVVPAAITLLILLTWRSGDRQPGTAVDEVRTRPDNATTPCDRKTP